MELAHCVNPRVPVPRITHSFHKIMRVFNSTGYWNFSEWGGFGMTCPIHTRWSRWVLDSSEALVSGIWLHAAFLNCIKLNANENDICLPKQCFAATFHAHTYTKWAEAWALNHKKHITNTMLCCSLKVYMSIQEVFDDYQYMLAVVTQLANDGMMLKNK